MATVPAAALQDMSGIRTAYVPPDPSTRMEQQRRPGSAVPTAKTNSRTRAGLLAELSGAGSDEAADGAGGGGGVLQPQLQLQVQQPGASLLSGSGVEGRERLQDRILQYTVQQLVMGEDEFRSHLLASGGSGGGACGAVRPPPPPKPVGLSMADALQAAQAMQRTSALAATVAAAAAGGQQQQQQAQQRERPQSAPSRRVRPPSAGHWAGRPQPEAVLSATLQRSSTGIVYCPDVQPGPLQRLYPQEPEGY